MVAGGHLLRTMAGIRAKACLAYCRCWWHHWQSCSGRGRYTIVIVTHNLAQARRVANYAGFFWMTERVGKLIEFGQCQRLFEAPAHTLTRAYVNGISG